MFRRTIPVLNGQNDICYSLVHRPDLPTRPAGVNLIQGKLADVIQFLDDLTYGPQSSKELLDGRQEWAGSMARYNKLLDSWRAGERP